MPVEKIFKIKEYGNIVAVLYPNDCGVFLDIAGSNTFAIIDVYECNNLISYLKDIVKNIEERDNLLDLLNDINETKG